MLTIHRFKNLIQEEQIDVMRQYGVHLDLYRQTVECLIALYALEDFYIELHIARHTDHILTIKSFSGTKKLAPYLDQVNIDPLTILLSY